LGIADLTRPELFEVYRQIGAGELSFEIEQRGGRGAWDFMTFFAQAFLEADEENYLILLPAVVAFVAKYRLVKPSAELGKPKGPNRVTHSAPKGSQTTPVACERGKDSEK
jgi:hypothetical protein